MPPPLTQRTSSIPRIITVTRKSYPHIRIVKTNANVTTTRTVQQKTLTVDKLSPQLAYFNQKTSAETQNVEIAKDTYAEKRATKGKFALSALGTTSLDHVLTCNTALGHRHLHLILSDYLSSTCVQNLNNTSKPFTYFQKMLSHVEPNIVFKLL